MGLRGEGGVSKRAREDRGTGRNSSRIGSQEETRLCGFSGELGEGVARATDRSTYSLHRRRARTS